MAGAGTQQAKPSQKGFQPGPRSLPAPTPVLGATKSRCGEEPPRSACSEVLAAGGRALTSHPLNVADALQGLTAF